MQLCVNFIYTNYLTDGNGIIHMRNLRLQNHRITEW